MDDLSIEPGGCLLARHESLASPRAVNGSALRRQILRQIDQDAAIGADNDRSGVGRTTLRSRFGFGDLATWHLRTPTLSTRAAAHGVGVPKGVRPQRRSTRVG